MEEENASMAGSARSTVLGYCSTVPLYSTFQAEKITVTEQEVATQILAPLLAQIAARHPLKELHKCQKEAASPTSGRLVDPARPKREASRLGASKADGPGEMAEVWEAGAVAYELLVGQPPAAMPSAPSTGLVRQTSFLGFLGFLSDDCVDFLQGVLREGARERLSAVQCQQHPWMRLHTAKQQATGKDALNPGPLASAAEPHPLWVWPPVGTFGSPSHSLSPIMAAWKIPAHPQESRPSSGSSASDACLEQTSPHRRAPASPGSDEEAEDIFPRTSPSQGSSGLLASKRSNSLTHITEADLGEETGETQPSTDASLRRMYSVGKSRFA